MIENYRKKLYKPVLWLTVAQIVLAFGYFIKILGDTMAVHSSRSGMAPLFMVFFGVVIIAVLFGSIRDPSVAHRLSRLFLGAALFLYMPTIFVAMGRQDTFGELLLALLPAALWLLSLMVIYNPPRGMPRIPRTEAPHLKQLRARLFKPALYVTILFTHWMFIRRIDWQGENPWFSLGIIALFTLLCVVGIFRGWDWILALGWLYLIMQVLGSIGAFFVVAAAYLQSSPLGMLASLVYGALLPVWLVFLWIVHKPPGKPEASESPGNNDAGYPMDTAVP